MLLLTALVTLAHREAGLPKRTPKGAAAGNGPVGRRERSCPARDIWISSGLRSGASGLRESPAFRPVGFVWNSLDSLVRNEPFQWVTSDLGPILFFGGPVPPRSVTRAVVDPKVDRDETPRRAEKAGRAGDHGSRHREVRSGHWDQTNAAFAFLQGIVDLAPFYTRNSTRQPLPARSPDARLFNELSERGANSAPEPKPNWP